MTAVKTINTSQSTISAVTRKWHLIAMGVVVATLILREALSTAEEPQVEAGREWSILMETSPPGKPDRRCVGRWNQLAYVDCHPDPEPSPVACWERGCCWIPDRQMAAPQCVFPFSTNRYALTSPAKTMDAWTANLTLLKNAPVPLPMSESTTVAVTFIAFAYEFARLRIHDAKEKEFETPVPPVPQGDGVPIASYGSTTHSNVVFVRPNRFPTYHLRFLVNEMFHARNFKQLPVKLPSEIVYGLRGAHGVPFANASQWSKHTFFRSHPQQRTSAVYESVHPFFVVASKSTSVGLFLRTSNDVEVTLSPNRVATFRVSGGVLDFFIFFGATPAEVTALYTRFVGLPAMPSLKFIEDGFPANTGNKAVPFAMFFQEEIKKSGMDDPLSLAVLRDVGGGVLKCRSGPGFEQRLVDLTHPAADHEWTRMFEAFHLFEKFNSADVMWLEAFRCPSGARNVTDCPEHVRRFPYDVCGTAQLHLSAYSDVRSAYGYLMARMAHRVIARKFGAYPTLATSNDMFPGIGKWNVFWNLTRDEGAGSLTTAILDIQLYSMLGLPYFLSSLCRVEDVKNKFTYNVCSLWLSLAAFLPVTQRVKISSKWDGALNEDGELKPEGRYAIAAKDARSLRSKFLPHLYTLIYKCSTTGDMIVRPLPFEFPGEPQPLGYSTQFMLGKHVMVVPKTQHQELLESQRASNTTLQTSPPTPLYIPRGTWYEWSSWRRVESRGSVIFMPSTNTSHPRLFVREGGIVVTRCKSSELSRNETRNMRGATFLELTVCLDATGSAEGELIAAPREKDAPNARSIEKNTHFRFFYARNFLAGYCSPCAHGDVLRNVTVLGLANAPSRVEFNGKEIPFRIDEEVLTVKRILHVMTKPFVMKVT